MDEKLSLRFLCISAPGTKGGGGASESEPVRIQVNPKSRYITSESLCPLELSGDRGWLSRGRLPSSTLHESVSRHSGDHWHHDWPPRKADRQRHPPLAIFVTVRWQMRSPRRIPDDPSFKCCPVHPSQSSEGPSDQELLSGWQIVMMSQKYVQGTDMLSSKVDTRAGWATGGRADVLGGS